MRRSFREDLKNVSVLARACGFSCYCYPLDPYVVVEDITCGENGYHITYEYTDGDELTFYIVKYEDFQQSGLEKTVWYLCLDMCDMCDMFDIYTDPCEEIRKEMDRLPTTRIT